MTPRLSVRCSSFPLQAAPDTAALSIFPFVIQCAQQRRVSRRTRHRGRLSMLGGRQSAGERRGGAAGHEQLYCPAAAVHSVGEHTKNEAAAAPGSARLRPRDHEVSSAGHRWDPGSLAAAVPGPGATPPRGLGPGSCPQKDGADSAGLLDTPTQPTA